MMEIQIKKAVKAGNSSAVVLPKAWLNKEVRVELVKKDPETILREVMSILNKRIPIDDVIGIYLVGSYARNEQTAESDIDILVLTDKSESEEIEEGIYSIMIVSSRLLSQKLKGDLLPVGLMIAEAKPLLNSSYLKLLDARVTKSNVKCYFETTEEKLVLVRKALDKLKNAKYVPAEIIYTLVLRIRTINTIEKLIKNQKYSKKDLINIIDKVSGGKNSYECYSAVKNDHHKDKTAIIEEAEKLYNYLSVELNRVRRMVN